MKCTEVLDEKPFLKLKTSKLSLSLNLLNQIPGALMSATDTVATLAVFSHLDVPPLLHNLVFGESVLNDAVAIVLFRTLVEFYDSPLSAITPLAVAARFGVVLAGSTIAGVAVALACAFVLKRFELAPEAGGWAQVEFVEQQRRQAAANAARAAAESEDGGLLSEDLPTPARNPPRRPSANGGLSFSGPETYEMCLVCLGAYLSYLVAEAVGLSGIVALFSAGVAHAHYSLNSWYEREEFFCFFQQACSPQRGSRESSFFHSLFFSLQKKNFKNINSSPDARIALRRCFETAAFLCETFVFAYLGLQVPSIFTRTVDWGLLLTVVPLCVASRAAAVFPLAKAANARRALPLPSGVVSALAACGLRGAVAYGLAVNLPAIKGESRHGIPSIEAATLVAVVASTLAAAPGADSLLRRWNLLGASDDDLLRRALEETRGMSQGEAAEALSAAKARGDDADRLLAAWAQLDSRVLKPLFGGKVKVNAALGGILFRGGPIGGGGAEEEEEEEEEEPLAGAFRPQPATTAAAATTAASGASSSPLFFNDEQFAGTAEPGMYVPPGGL